MLQANVEQNQEEEGKWAATKGMKYSSRGRKLDYSRKAIYQMIFPLICWMLLVILNWGLSYMFLRQTTPRLDDVNGNSRVQAYSKLPVWLLCDSATCQNMTSLAALDCPLLDGFESATRLDRKPTISHHYTCILTSCSSN